MLDPEEIARYAARQLAIAAALLLAAGLLIGWFLAQAF